ncbi:MAG: hypothetical protein K2X55_23580 [Burkholderiaceae bacterium]|nr:hypothetical protein [Burkholderiaceae bacterium]
MKTMTLAVSGLFAAAVGLTAWPGAALAGHILSGVNMKSCELLLINAETDQMAKVALPTVYGWQAATCQHTAISHDEKTVYMLTDAVPPFTASVVTVHLKQIDWDAGTINAKVLQTLPLAQPGSPSQFKNVMQVVPQQPIMPWTRPAFTQTHGPTFLPNSKFFYVTHYTDNRVRGFKMKGNGKLHPIAVYADGDLTRQTHGVNFNNSGTRGLGVGYDYDMGTVRVYKPKTKTGEVKVIGEIKLGTEQRYGAMAHYAVWLTDRYAYIGTMQQGPTSLTKPGHQVIEPSIWLIDVHEMKATRVIGMQKGQRPGLLRSPSDVALAHDKLYVAEEDSWGRLPNAPATDYGRDGYVSIWDVSDPDTPKFIKRLAPGQGLPADFRNAHTASAIEDGDAVYVSSFISNHLIKIDTETDTVTKVYSMDDGLMMYHGEFAAGRNR